MSQLQIPRVGIDWFGSVECKLKQIVMAATVRQLDPITASELADGASINISTEIALCRWLALQGEFFLVQSQANSCKSRGIFPHYLKNWLRFVCGGKQLHGAALSFDIWPGGFVLIQPM